MNFRSTPLFFAFFLLASSTLAQPIDAATAAKDPKSALPSADTKNSESNTAEQNARTEARDRFAAGIKLYEDGDFALALIEFDRAYLLIPDFRVLYNIGQVNIQLGRYARAVRSLRQYLNDGGDRIPEERRIAVANDLNMLAVRTASILVKVNVAEAEVLLDSDVVAQSPMTTPVLVDAGEHKLTLRKLGYVSQTKPLALAGRDTVTIDISLVPEPKRDPSEKTVIVEQKPLPYVNANDPRNTYLLLGWSAVGLLGAGWATTGYFGYQSAQDRSDALTRKTSSAELDHLESKTKHWYLASDVFGVTTLVAAGTMLYYTIKTTPSMPASETKPVSKSSYFFEVGPQRVTFSGAF
jgi:tetratricopeptide (TPR) repeat protein